MNKSKYLQKSLKYRKHLSHQYCINCGKDNHNYSNCMETLNSYGILCFYNDVINVNGNTTNNYKLVMVRRQRTIPYVEFLRGKYHTSDLEYLIILFSRMTIQEIKLIVSNPNFSVLREDLKLNNKQKKKYKDEYNMAENKFNVILATGNLHYIIYVINNLFNTKFVINNKSLNINLLEYESYIKKNIDWIKSIKIKLSNTSIYTSPEWGIPKGRRQNKESNLKCALREFSEETGLKPNSIKIYKNVIPLEETYIGLNGIEYKHTYFLAECIKLPDNIKYEDITNTKKTINTDSVYPLNDELVSSKKDLLDISKSSLYNDYIDNNRVKYLKDNQLDIEKDTINIINSISNPSIISNKTKNEIQSPSINYCTGDISSLDRQIVIPIKENNKEQLLEISKVTIMSLYQIKEIIRAYHIQKLNIINKAFYIILQKKIFFE